MEFIDVIWRHNNEEDPVRLVLEINGDRYETRKLEFFPDGGVGFSSGVASSRNTQLGTAPLPSIQEINSDSQFHASIIDSQEFEALWSQYARHT